MNTPNLTRPLTRAMLLRINLALLVLILFFGLRFRDFSLTNHVAWLDGRNGIRIGHNGIAYAEIGLPRKRAADAPTALTIEMALKAEDNAGDRFRFVLSVNGGQDEAQLLLGQWRHSLIVMNGDDYDGHRGIPKLGVRDALPPQTSRLITVTADGGGTRVYLDGVLADASSRFTLHLPVHQPLLHLVLGNSIYARHSWSGDVYGLAIYPYAFTPEQVAHQSRLWRSEQRFAALAATNATVFYAFAEGRGVAAADGSGAARDLQLPPRMKILAKEVLAAPWQGNGLSRQLILDMLINVAGFMPFGFFLYALLLRSTPPRQRLAIPLTIGVCLVTSLTIEVVQAWIPSRSSQSLDLILNTAGGGLGVLCYRLGQRLPAVRRLFQPQA